MITLLMRDLIATLAIGSTQPMVRRRIGIEACVTSTTLTATAGLPLSGAPVAGPGAHSGRARWRLLLAASASAATGAVR